MNASFNRSLFRPLIKSTFGLVLLTTFLMDPQLVRAQSIPLHLPFQIHIRMTGSFAYDHIKRDTAQHETRDTTDVVVDKIFIIDTTLPGSHLYWSGQTLRYFDSEFFADEYARMSYSANILFDSTYRTITTLTLNTNEQYSDRFIINSEVYNNWGLELSNLRFTIDSIYERDSLTSPALISLSCDSAYTHQDDVPPFYSYSDARHLIDGRVNIRGASQLKSDVNISQATALFGLTWDNEGIQCSFMPSSKERSIRIYSVIGALARSITIEPGQDHITIDNVANGLYFVLLDDALVRIYIP